MLNCGNCTNYIDTNAVTTMQCVFCTLHFHMRCENVDLDEQRAIAKPCEQLKYNIFAACVACVSKRKSQPGIVFFKDMVDHKEKSGKRKVRTIRLNSLKLKTNCQRRYRSTRLMKNVLKLYATTLKV